MKKYTYEEARADLMIADKLIKKRHRYDCGIEDFEKKHLFFLSPDRQNSELLYELKKLKWRESGYNAPYYWNVSKRKVFIQYREGDITIIEV